MCACVRACVCVCSYESLSNYACLCVCVCVCVLMYNVCLHVFMWVYRHVIQYEYTQNL